jgi:hypothetical protein
MNDNRIATYTACIEKVCAWTEENLKPDGSWGWESSSSGYLSVAPFANAIGRRDWSLRVLRHVQEHFLDDQGALQQDSRFAEKIGYVPSWFVWGATGAGCFELSNCLANGLTALQCPRSGGLFGSIQGARQGGRIEFDATTMGTLAFARSGRTGSCTRAADYLVGLLESQPDFNHCLYTEWEEPGGLVTEEASGFPVLRWDQPRQGYYKIGLFVVALVEAYGVSGSQDYLQAAISVYRHCTERAVDLWSSMLSHKMVWAAARLHAVTHEPQYTEDACRLADHLATLQHPDGTFPYPEVWATFPPEPWDLVPNLAFQAGLWLALARDILRS